MSKIKPDGPVACPAKLEERNRVERLGHLL